MEKQLTSDVADREQMITSLRKKLSDREEEINVN
jgi:hypothetical protein